MLAFLLRRLMQSGVVLLVMSVLVFVGVYAIGNPVDILINPEADQAEIDRTMVALGLDKPLWTQYLIFLRQALAGDFGHSFVHARTSSRMRELPSAVSRQLCPRQVARFAGAGHNRSLLGAVS